jgi:acetyltransferase-like isoleucine patch superfamily enzyme
VHIGAHTFVNHGAYFMDGAKITIGEHCFIGPDFGAYTAQHPLVAEERNSFIERALPIEVGNNVWIGARVTLLPGVHIGEGSVIAAGAVVTKDIPAHVLAAGVPARVVRPITDEDRIKK